MMLITATAILLATGVSAHTIFTQLHVNGVAQGHLKGVRVPTYDGPIQDVTSNDIICNGGLNPLRTPLPTDIINVKAGDKLTAEWHHTLDSKPETDKSDPIDPGHLGPIMVYLAKVDNALTTTVTGLKWFKIYEDGMDAKGEWAVTRLYNNKGKVDFVLPSCVPAGQYLLRAELIALHGAANYPGAQFYMECAQINVAASSVARRQLAPRAFSPNYVSFPGAYKGTDPGVKFQLYWPKPTSYTIPGPRPLVC
ncbi:glycoside hydrolase family 61 protein [Paraphoma chrysanthemicola]|nr:glycoside hydrolase family 61 protein [Paraphoma chrysanthemicola]